jgi:hypothetical protein
MSDTSKTVFELLKGDTDLISLLGDDGSGDRIFREWPGDDLPELADASPAYLIFSRESDPTIGGSGYGNDELWQVHIRAKDPDTRDRVKNRVRAIVTSLIKAEQVLISDRHHLGGGQPTCGPDGYSETLQAYTVNVRFSLQSITT